MPTSRAQQIETAARVLLNRVNQKVMDPSVSLREPANVVLAALCLPDDAPKWSSQVPTVAGPTWRRNPRHFEGRAHVVYFHADGVDVIFQDDEWQPIPEPVGE